MSGTLQLQGRLEIRDGHNFHQPSRHAIRVAGFGSIAEQGGPSQLSRFRIELLSTARRGIVISIMVRFRKVRRSFGRRRTFSLVRPPLRLVVFGSGERPIRAGVRLVLLVVVVERGRCGGGWFIGSGSSRRLCSVGASVRFVRRHGNPVRMSLMKVALRHGDPATDTILKLDSGIATAQIGANHIFAVMDIAWNDKMSRLIEYNRIVDNSGWWWFITRTTTTDKRTVPSIQRTNLLESCEPPACLGPGRAR
jgi:hypothetical protein